MSYRLAKLKQVLKTDGVDALLVTNAVNTYYMSGLKAEGSALVIAENENFIITDSRFKEDAEDLGNFKVLLTNTSAKDVLKKIANDLNIKRLGFEANHLSYTKANSLARFLKKEKIRFEPLTGLIEELRVYKDEAELREIKKTIAIAKHAIGALKKEIGKGVTEKRLAGILDNLIRSYGGDANAFETIIVSGRNSSRPHARPTDKPIRAGENCLIDFGVALNCYNCDLTRVVFLGRIQRQLKDIYNICLEAQGRAIKKIRPGVRADEIDKVARAFIFAKGYGKFFGHALGHGVGLEVHELPQISPKTRKTIKPNMVFTVEPGIYLEGLGGARVEDMVLVTEKGCEVLTDDIPK